MRDVFARCCNTSAIPVRQAVHLHNEEYRTMRILFAAAALSLLLTGVVHGAAVEIGEPVTAVGVDVDLRNLPVAPAWRPGMLIREAHKRQFFPPNRLDPSAPASLQVLPDRLPELQKIWDDQ